MLGLYWYFRECWILRGFKGLQIGIKYKILCFLNSHFHFTQKSGDFT